MMKEVRTMTDKQYKSHLKELLAFVRKADTIQEIIDFILDLLRDYQ